MSSRLVQPPGVVPLHRVLWGSLKPRYWLAAGVTGGCGFLVLLFAPLPFFVRLCVALPPLLVVLALACPWRGKQLDVWLMEALDFHWRALCYALVKPRGPTSRQARSDFDESEQDEEEVDQEDPENSMFLEEFEEAAPLEARATAPFLAVLPAMAAHQEGRKAFAAAPASGGQWRAAQDLAPSVAQRSVAGAAGGPGEAGDDPNSLGPLWKADGSAAYGQAGVFMRGIQQRLASAGFRTARRPAPFPAEVDLAYQPGFGWYDAGGLFLSDQSGRSPAEGTGPHPAAAPAGKRRGRT